MIFADFSPQMQGTPIAKAVKIWAMAGRPPKPQKHYPNRLRAIREGQHLTIDQVAKRLRWATQTLQRYELGERALKVFQIDDVAQALGVRPEALLNSYQPIEALQEQEMLVIMRRITPEARGHLMKMARGLLTDEQAAE